MNFKTGLLSLFGLGLLLSPGVASAEVRSIFGGGGGFIPATGGGGSSCLDETCISVQDLTVTGSMDVSGAELQGFTVNSSQISGTIPVTQLSEPIFRDDGNFLKRNIRKLKDINIAKNAKIKRSKIKGLNKQLNSKAEKDDVHEYFSGDALTLNNYTFSIGDGQVTEPKLDISDDPADAQILSWNDGAGQMEWVAAPSAPVSSVFGRTGAVTAQANDYSWGQIDKTTSSLADITTRSAGDLSSGNLDIARMPAGGTWALTTNLHFNGNNLVVDHVNGRVGVGTASPSHTLQVVGQIRGSSMSNANGTQGTPSYRFNDDADTGMFRASANNLAFTTAGAEAVRIDAGGQVGIGTNSPDEKLEVAGGNIYVSGVTDKLIMVSGDGSCHACGPNDFNAWICTTVTCP